MKRFLIPLLAVLTLCATQLSASARTIKLGTLAPEGSPWHEILRDMAEGWKAASDGKVTVRYRKPSVLFKPYGHPDLDAMAAELDQIFAEIVGVVR